MALIDERPEPGENQAVVSKGYASWEGAGSGYPYADESGAVDA